MDGVRKIVSHVFLTDHIVVDVPSEAMAGVQPLPPARDTASRAGETKAKSDAKEAKKKPSPRSAAPRIAAP
jgi:hypothetical protein